MTAAAIASALRIPTGLMTAAGWREAADAEVRDALGYRGHRGCDLSGVLMPLRHPRTGEHLGDICRVSHPPTGAPRYVQPQGCRWLYVPPVPAEWLGDPAVPVAIAEGPKSALALLALAQRHGRRIVPIATGGCWGWRRTVTHAPQPDGTLAGVTGPSPSLDWVAWPGREAIVALDGDARTNPDVRRALRGLAGELAGRGANVRVAAIPADAGPKAGPDDVIERLGDDAVLATLDAARPWAECAAAAAEAAVGALEALAAAARRTAEPPTAEIACVADPALRARLVARVASLRLPGATKGEIGRAVGAELAAAAERRAQAAEAARKGRLMGLRVDGAALLTDIAAWMRLYVVMSAAQADAVGLWVVHTYALDAADYTPYIHVTAPEKRCGKSRLLEVLELLAARAWRCDRTTAAALLRSVERDSPTLLLDEFDAASGGGEEYAEAMRGLMNSGFRRGGAYRMCAAPDWEPRDYPTFCPKAIAGIGRLPDTVADRSLTIALRRKAPNERVAMFRRREAEPEAAVLRERAEAWAMRVMDRLRAARPELPAVLNDRQRDITEPLLAIADLAGGEWPGRARRALVAICTGGAAADDSIGVRLLADVRQTFGDRQADRIASRDLAETLGGMEDRPWAEWGRAQKPITPPQVARLLGRHGIAPHTIRDGEARYKGYLAADFAEAWARYVAPDRPPDDPPPPDMPLPNGDTVTRPVNIERNGNFAAVTSEACHRTENGVLTNEHAGCHRVTARNPENGDAASQRPLFGPPPGEETLGAAYARARREGRLPAEPQRGPGGDGSAVRGREEVSL